MTNQYGFSPLELAAFAGLQPEALVSDPLYIPPTAVQPVPPASTGGLSLQSILAADPNAFGTQVGEPLSPTYQETLPNGELLYKSAEGWFVLRPNGTIGPVSEDYGAQYTAEAPSPEPPAIPSGEFQSQLEQPRRARGGFIDTLSSLDMAGFGDRPAGTVPLSDRFLNAHESFQLYLGELGLQNFEPYAQLQPGGLDSFRAEAIRDYQTAGFPNFADFVQNEVQFFPGEGHYAFGGTIPTPEASPEFYEEFQLPESAAGAYPAASIAESEYLYGPEPPGTHEAAHLIDSQIGRIDPNLHEAILAETFDFLFQKAAGGDDVAQGIVERFDVGHAFTYIFRHLGETPPQLRSLLDTADSLMGQRRQQFGGP